jgi:hypothetical protein
VPEFRPYERKHASKRSLPAAEFLTKEEQDNENEEDVVEGDIICIDEVFHRAQTYALALFSASDYANDAQ